MACSNAALAEEQLRNAKDTTIDGKSVEALYNAGVAAANKKQWEKACDFFTQAFAREANPQIAANLGNAELRAGRMRLAAEHLDYFLQEDKESDKQARLEIQSLRDQAAKHVVMVQVIVDHDGADIVVDGIVRGKSPLKGSVFLEPGTHKFEARKVGFTAQEQSFDLDKDVRREIRIKMDVDPRALYASKKKGGKAGEPMWRTPMTVLFSGLAVVAIGTGIATGLTYRDHPGRFGSKEGFDALAKKTQEGHKVCGPDSPPENAEKCAKLLENAQRADLLSKVTIASFAIAGAALISLATIRLYPTNEPHRTRLLPAITPTAASLFIIRDF